MSNICVDTGFLVGLYDETDQFHEFAAIHFDECFVDARNQLVVPFPIVYEAVSTRFVKNRKAMTKLQKDWERLQAEKRLQLFSDMTYRVELIDECFRELEKARGSYRALSIVDRVIRRILSDVDVKIDAFITYNPGDFIDICARFKRELLS